MHIGGEREASFERVQITPVATRAAYPEEFRSRIAIDTLHDGDLIPRRLLRGPGLRWMMDSGALWRAFVTERDWGADLVAGHLAAALGLSDFFRVRIARVVMDFNRLPGDSPPDTDPFDQRALSEPVSQLLGYADKRYLLEHHYDAISAGMDAAISGRLLKLSIHTYDTRNQSRTKRPAVSLLTRSDSYQRRSRLPYGLFDPLFPDELVESCAKPVVRDRVALTLEKAGIAVAHNYPYSLPDGSVEIRCQPWLFFQHLRARYEDARPETSEDPAHQLVWEMLLNTNRRGGTSDALSGYLHRFQTPPEGCVAAFERARDAYERLRDFMAQRPALTEAYRRSPDRTSTITIEVRKDLVWRFDRGGEPLGPRDDEAREVATLIAEAIATYLREDRAEAALSGS